MARGLVAVSFGLTSFKLVLRMVKASNHDELTAAVSGCFAVRILNEMMNSKQN